jgi:hypothetical protein
MKNELYKKNGKVAPLSVAASALSELMTFIEVSVAGLKDAAQARQILHWSRMAKKVLGERDSFSDDHYAEVAGRAKSRELFARAEERYDFPYLYGMATTRLWTILETMVEDLLAYLLQTRLECRELDIVRGLEGPLVQFASAHASDRARYLADLLTEQVKAKFKLGIGRFEAVLNPIRLGGPVDPDVQRTILELSQIRHVIVHRLGKADEKLATTCPWLNLRPGQRVRVTEKQFRRFWLAFFWYMLELDRRMATLFSEDMSEFKTRIHRECLNELRQACTADNDTAKERAVSNVTAKARDERPIIGRPEPPPTQRENTSPDSDVSVSNQLRELLLEQDRKELRKTAQRIQKLRREQTIISVALKLADKLVTDMIATRLVQPGVWLRNADYSSKITLAKTLGLLGREEYSICCVLASARRASERLNSLPEKSRARIVRIAYAHFKREPPRPGHEKSLNEIIRLLLAILSASWLEVRYKKNVYELRRRYKRQWSSLMKKKLWSDLDLLATNSDSPESNRAVDQVDLQFLKRLRSKKKFSAKLMPRGAGEPKVRLAEIGIRFDKRRRAPVSH